MQDKINEFVRIMSLVDKNYHNDKVDGLCRRIINFTPKLILDRIC